MSPRLKSNGAGIRYIDLNLALRERGTFLMRSKSEIVSDPNVIVGYTRNGRRKSSLAHIKAKFSRHYPSAANSARSSVGSTPRESGSQRKSRSASGRKRESMFNSSLKRIEHNLNDRFIMPRCLLFWARQIKKTSLLKLTF